MLALLVSAAVAAAPPGEPSPYFLDDSVVVMVDCKDWTGSAFYIGKGLFLTARHVVRDDKGKIVHCRVGNGLLADKPITVIQVGAIHDYAVFKAPYYLPYRAIISCAGFQEGHNYYAQGYAYGREWVVTQRLIGTATSAAYTLTNGKHPHFVIGVETKGSTTEGQSGGPVSDDDGLVVGIVSAGDDAGESMQIFVSLADTPLCPAKGTSPATSSEIK